MIRPRTSLLRPRRVAAGVFGLFSLFALDGRAQPAASGSASSDRAPAFVTLDRGNTTSYGDASLATSFFDGEDPDFNMRLDLYGQIVFGGGTGGYFSLPVSYLANNDESETALGNLEVGGLHNLQLNPNTILVLRGGITLPTAADDIEGLVTNLANSHVRLTDFIAVYPDTSALRVATSAVHTSGKVVFRVDGGFDIPLSSPEGADSDPIVRLNLGFGVMAGQATFSGELVSVGKTGEVGLGEDRTLHSIAAAARFDFGAAQAFGAVVLPLDANGTTFEVDLSLIAGARIPIPL